MDEACGKQLLSGSDSNPLRPRRGMMQKGKHLGGSSMIERERWRHNPSSINRTESQLHYCLLDFSSFSTHTVSH